VRCCLFLRVVCRTGVCVCMLRHEYLGTPTGWVEKALRGIPQGTKTEPSWGIGPKQ